MRVGVHIVAVDSGSLEARKKRLQVKSDRVDLENLLRMLVRFRAGDQIVCGVVRLSDPRVGARRQLHRVRWSLFAWRGRHVNPIKGLLTNQRVNLPLNGDFPPI